MAAPKLHMLKKESKELQDILAKYPSLKWLEETKKIKCDFSGHEMPCKVEVLLSYVNGKKFQKLLAEQNFEQSEIKDHLVPSKKKGREQQLFCMLTWRHINKNPEHIKRHIEGRRFKKAFAKWKECQKTGEKFQPNRGRPKQEKMDTEGLPDKTNSDTENEGEVSDVDSLSDLYPVEEIENLEENEEPGQVSKNSRLNEENSDSDFEFEDMDVQVATGQSQNAVQQNANAEKYKGQKRKSQENFKKKKKKKTN